MCSSDLAHRSRFVLGLALAGCVIGALNWLWLVVEASTDRRTLIVDFQDTASPWYRMWRQLLPDHTRMNGIDIALTAIWTVVLVGAGALVWWSTRIEQRAAVDEPATDPADDHGEGAEKGEPEWQTS